MNFFWAAFRNWAGKVCRTFLLNFHPLNHCLQISCKMIWLKCNKKFVRCFSSVSSTLKEVIAKRELNQEVKVNGWIKTVRAMKSHLFADINDGSTCENLQLVCDKTDKDKLGFGSSVTASGLLSETPKGQLELQVKSLEVVGECPLDGTYPYVARQSYTPEYIRQNLHFRSRVSSFNSMVRCRHNLTNIINNYLHQEGFFQVHTPILTGHYCAPQSIAGFDFNFLLSFQPMIVRELVKCSVSSLIAKLC